jgi:hypothetical protein
MLRAKRLSAASILFVAGAAAAQVQPGERIPITDPDRLVALGFPKDAKNVFVWSKADLKGGQVLGDAAVVAAPETWGSHAGYSTALGVQLQAHGEEYVRLYRDLTDGTYCSWDDLFSFPADAWAQISVPDGARLGSFRFWAEDSHATKDLKFAIFESCQAGSAAPVNTLLGQTQTFLAVGDYTGFTDLNDLAVDNRDCAYVVRVRFADGGSVDCTSDLKVRKLQFTWNRQVSPAPVTASFNDVPTTHPYFRFVEALKDSGITGGCSVTPALYCPNSPITRGEMAVFLAAALGLSWP